jgi:hypothetical protein
LAKGRWIESSIYTPKRGNQAKKGKYALADTYRQKQSKIACSALKQESLPNGLIIHLRKSSSYDVFL